MTPQTSWTNDSCMANRNKQKCRFGTAIVKGQSDKQLITRVAVRDQKGARASNGGDGDGARLNREKDLNERMEGEAMHLDGDGDADYIDAPLKARDR